jgi:hypothetical protein
VRTALVQEITWEGSLDVSEAGAGQKGSKLLTDRTAPSRLGSSAESDINPRKRSAKL